RNWPEALKPDTILAEIHGGRAASGATPQAAPQEPHALVKQAKEAYEAGRLDEAEDIGLRARNADSKNVSWGLFEETPNSLLNKIARAKAKRDREESWHLLAQARQALENGDFENARRLSFQ